MAEDSSYRSNLTSYNQDSYKPPTPSLEPHQPAQGYDSSYTKVRRCQWLFIVLSETN